ncbi:FecR domain-containing protein [Marivirga sp.]|uniref:FecR domain-containing protein n=1 Tax=Marivirga sp. TaxID=2018662 RepID=UPI0025D9479F|nr:FecR domain-containing protein [Marivirga sp.]
MEKSYSKIWKYLEGKLSPQEEEELMDWIGESERNADFFNQVIQDYNEIITPSPAQNTHYKWYWAAASVILFLSISIWIFNPFISEAPLQNFTLSDGSEVTISSDSKFEYDSISFESTKWVKIQGTAEISTKAKEHLLIETQNGYLILEGNSSLQIQELKHKEMNVFVEKGNIRWLNPTVTTEELVLVSGEKLLFKKDGKTVISYNKLKAQKTFLIFENYMNL